MFLIVGLGNPGKEYENTRHNLGFQAIDELATRLQIAPKNFKAKFQSLLVKTKIDSQPVVLAKPQTFMNNSGQAVRELLAYFKIEAQNLVVIYDDVDLAVGQLKLKDKGSAGGHHGIESIIEQIKATDFIRLRIGIGRPKSSGDVSNYVLGKISGEQKEPLGRAVSVAAETVATILSQGLARAMNLFN